MKNDNNQSLIAEIMGSKQTTNFSTIASTAIETIHTAFDFWNLPELKHECVIDFNNRFTSKMGMASYRSFWTPNYKIQLSKKLCEVASIDEVINTAVHEAAHIADHKLHGYMDGHGHRWQRLMISAGYKPERCHKVVDFVEVHVVNCQRCNHMLKFGKITVKRYKSGRYNYRCPRCFESICGSTRLLSKEEVKALLK